MNCTDLAATLSHNYRNIERYNKDQHELPSYLNTHGILFTICMPLFQCNLPIGTQHISASWINELTGVETIGAQSNVGLLLDPLKVKIECLYPTDAASSWRDDSGCGPFQMDPVFGSKGAHSLNPQNLESVRRDIVNYKNMNFGVDTLWEDINCVDYFPLVDPFGPLPLGWDFSQDEPKAFVHQSYYAVLQQNVAAIMGHPVCSVDEGYGTSPWMFRVYTGVESWRHPAEDWHTVMDLQLDLAVNYSQVDRRTVESNFNELVLAMPKTELQDIVLGVFFLDDDDGRDPTKRLRALSEGKLLGDKPVFRLRKKPGKRNLLTCLDSNEAKEYAL